MSGCRAMRLDLEKTAAGGAAAQPYTGPEGGAGRWVTATGAQGIPRATPSALTGSGGWGTKVACALGTLANAGGRAEVGGEVHTGVTGERDELDVGERCTSLSTASHIERSKSSELAFRG